MPGDEPPAVAAEGDDAADFGEEAAAQETTSKPAPAAPPQRAMPDYGDIVDGDDAPEAKPEKVAVKDEEVDAAASAPKRPDAILIRGVQRLNRGHFTEMFEAKNLPELVRIDWVSDAEAVVLFDSEEDAGTVLKSALEGFRDVDVDEAPGPGLWRAQRGMLDFRMATIADKPEFGFKKLHRAGRQVKDFRMWSALTDIDKQILNKEDEIKEQYKRPAPGHDDLDDESQPKKKRRKTGDDDAFDLLERMAQSDKQALVKQEETGDLDELPELPQEERDEYGCTAADWGRDSFDDDQGGRQRGGRRQQDRQQQWGQWGHDDQNSWWDNEDDRWGGKRSGKKGGKKGGGKGRRRDNDDWESKDTDTRKGRGKGNSVAADLGEKVEATTEELERRAKRNARFQAAKKED